jgi:AcrR family transcriptional regulator
MASMPRRATQPTTSRATARPALSRERVVTAAMELADRDGLDALSMRRLGGILGVDPMSLYNHVRDKDDLLDAMADTAVAGIAPSPGEGHWTERLRSTILSARATMLRHPWAPRLIEQRDRPGPATLRYFDTVIGILMDGGLAIDLTHHALHLLGSRVIGFNQDLFDDRSEAARDPAVIALMASQLADSHPYVARMAGTVSHEGGLGGCDDDVEFTFALDLILEGLDRRHRAG